MRRRVAALVAIAAVALTFSWAPGAGAAPIAEKDLNLDIAQRVATILRSKGVDVVLTRESDASVPLIDRARVAKDADFLISVHNTGSTNPNASGTEVYAQIDDEASAQLARHIHDAVVARAGTRGRGVIRRVGANGDYYAVLRNSPVPAVIVEGAFLTNREDARRLADPKFRQAMAEGIAEGIMAQFGTLTGTSATPPPARSLQVLFAPTGLTAARTGASVGRAFKLTWDPVLAASGYEVWRNGVLMTTTALPSYTDIGLGTGRQRYEVRAVLDAAGLRVAESPPAVADVAGGKVVLDPGHGGGDPGAVGSS